MKQYRISIVSYSNTIPFQYGITKSEFIKNNSVITYDVPSECARKLLNNEADIGLIPAFVIPQLNNCKIVTNYCIGANQNVDSVKLFSSVPFEQINTIYLDSESRTSNVLAQIVAADLWHINPNITHKTKPNKLGDREAYVAIGDKAMISKAEFEYDLATEWNKLTGLPFVFACWVANTNVDNSFLNEFNSALELGVNDISSAIEFVSGRIFKFDISKYLNSSIDYNFDSNKQNALSEFWRLSKRFY